MDPPITTQTTTTTSSNDNDGGPTDPTTIIKRKRTKRQRPTNIILTNPSPTSSSDFPTHSTTTEDEDTANCLILLSKGGHNITMHSNNNSNSNINIINNNNNNMGESSGYKFNSKKYIQTSTDAVNGLTGIYVYECKTCSRTFSSFQALGGHRASHKKPRLIKEDDNRKPPSYMALSDEDEPVQFQSRKNHSSSSSSLSLQLNFVPINPNKFMSSKLHECSICGAEFNSGQALGGHMRRHRGNINNINITSTTAAADTVTNTTLSLVPYSAVAAVVTDDRGYQKSTDDGLGLDLDLNLPAPQEITVAVSDLDQGQQNEPSLSFKFVDDHNKQQQATVQLSAAPTLVDCHY